MRKTRDLSTCVLLAWAVGLLAIAGRAECAFQYSENQDGSISLTGVRGTPGAQVTIPAEYDGRRVSSVAYGFLSECKTVKSVEVLAGVTEIEDKAFRECPNLTSVQIAGTVRSIGRKAFANCANLVDVVLDEGVERLGDFVFTGAASLGKLSSVVLPASVTSIGIGAFTCNGLKSIVVAGGESSRFAVVEGVLYDKVDRRTICSCVNVRHVTLPPDCEIIGQDTFNAAWDGNSSLETVDWPPALRIIEQAAFARCKKLTSGDFSKTCLEGIDEDEFVLCTSLTTVRFPATLKYLTGHAFSCCSSLRSVHFDGDAPAIWWKTSHNKDMLDSIYVQTRNLDKNYDDNRPYTYSYLKDVVTYVKPGTTGWGNVPGTWQGCPIRYANGSDEDEPQTADVTFACPALADASLSVGVLGSGEGIPLEIEPLSAVKSVKASKLPSGMKLVKDKKTGLYAITGSPKKAGDYEVVFALTTTSGTKQTLTVPVRVEALPAWATGTFGGLVGRSVGVGEDDEWRPYGTVDVKVTAAGKITAKVAAGGKTYSFTANGYESVGERDGRPFCRFAMKTKKGDAYEGEITAAGHDVMTLMTEGGREDAAGAFTPAGTSPYRALLWRNEHGKDGHLSDDQTGRASATMDAIKALKKVALADFDPAYGSAVLTIGKDGSTKLSGTTADGVKLGGKGFLKLEGASCHVIADTAVFDKKSGNVYAITPCWQPIFDKSGAIVGWDEACCDHSLRIYPFE